MSALPRFVFDFDPGAVDEAQPLVYLWEVLGPDGVAKYRYVGKAIGGAQRPKVAYRLNVNHLLAGKPYRRGKPEGFRRVHRELADATRQGAHVRLRLIENTSVEEILDRERFWQGEYSADTDDAPEGDSIEQRIAERIALGQVSRLLNVDLVPAERDGMNFDGFSETPPTLVEIWAHTGAPKPAQKHKVTADALKLQFADTQLFGGSARKVIVTVDDEAAAPFRAGTWMARALAHFKVEVATVELPAELKERLRDAQRRQARGNR